MNVNKLLQSVLFLILQTHLCCAQSAMVVPSQPVIVPVGSDVTLPCQLDPVTDLRNLVVEWGRNDLKPRYIHIRRDGLDLLHDQNTLYQGRTRLPEPGLQVGDMSLKLSRTRLSDGGTYRCYIPQMNVGAEVKLLVVSVSPVSVTLTKDHSGSPELRCESRGWYPEPELVWLDSEGTVLTGGRTEMILANDEIFSVSSRLTMEQSHGNTVTCRVRQQETRQSRESQVTITGEFLEVPSCSVAWTLFSVGLCLLIAAAVAFVVWKFKLLKKMKSENKDIEHGDQEEKETFIKPDEDTSTGLKALLNTQSLELMSSEHKESLEKIQEEMKFVKNVINKLTETKEFLLQLKKKPQEVIHQLDSQITAEKKRSFNPLNPMKDKKMETQKESIQKLEQEKEEWATTVQHLDEQVKALETGILEATQRKGQLVAQFKNVEKLAENEQRRQKASGHPDPRQALNEVKVNVPVATVKAFDETQGAEGENGEGQEDVDGLTSAFGVMSIANKAQ